MMQSPYFPWKINSLNLKDPPWASNFRLIRQSSTSSPFFNRNKDSWLYQILDPRGKILTTWNRTFLAFCLLALFVDPLYFYLPKFGGSGCIMIDGALFKIVVVLRSIADLFYLTHIVLKFRTAYVLPGSRAIGRGELVTDPHQIAVHYLKSDFVIDFAAMLPLPQVMNWLIIPKMGHARLAHSNNDLALIVFIQYVPRLFLIFPLNRRIIKNTGVVTKTAWAGAAYNLLLFMLAGHVLGACWYLLSIQKQKSCWRDECAKELPRCQFDYLDCKTLEKAERKSWEKTTNVFANCDASNNTISSSFGIFVKGLASNAFYDHFIPKYLYCLWWGLKNLSSFGQNLATSGDISETAFCVLICIGGLVLFSHLIGNVQTYLQSMTVRLEEWRVKKRDIEEWMRHRQLPVELQERVHRFVQYKWLATRGVNEDTILHALPLDLRRDIQRHLCLALVRRVPFFAQMDNQLLDAICERLVSSLSTEETYVVREGDPVDEMLFVIRGQLESSTTNGGRSGFYNSIILRPGGFCGEELLTWALMPESENLPTSTRTVRALCEVEGFALRAKDLKYVANQFKLLHSKKLQHVFRYYSHQWRTWGACLLQAAWRRFKKRRLAEELLRRESCYYVYEEIVENDEPVEGEYVNEDADAASSSAANTGDGQHLGATMLASRFAANTRRVQKKIKITDPNDLPGLEIKKILKPDDPHFS